MTANTSRLLLLQPIIKSILAKVTAESGSRGRSCTCSCCFSVDFCLSSVYNPAHVESRFWMEPAASVLPWSTLCLPGYVRWQIDVHVSVSGCQPLCFSAWTVWCPVLTMPLLSLHVDWDWLCFVHKCMTPLVISICSHTFFSSILSPMTKMFPSTNVPLESLMQIYFKLAKVDVRLKTKQKWTESDIVTIRDCVYVRL